MPSVPSFLFLPFFLLLVGCAAQKDALPDPVLPAVPITYLALGDSYTIGHSVGALERFPEQLADSLRAAGLDVGPVRVIAKTGWTTAALQSAIDQATDLDSAYGMVTLLIGVNNQYQGGELDTYRKQYSVLLQRAVALAGHRKERVFVVSIPDYAFTPYGNGNPAISEGIDLFNEACRTLTEQEGVRFFNITPISREGLADPSLVASDGLHPSGKQYARWVGLLLPAVREALE